MVWKYPDSYQKQQKEVSEYVAQHHFGGKAHHLGERSRFDTVVTFHTPINKRWKPQAFVEVKNRKKVDERYDDWLVELPKAMSARSYVIATGVPFYICYAFGFIEGVTKSIYLHKLNLDLKNHYDIAFKAITYRNDPLYDDNVMIYIKKTQCEKIL